MHACACHIPSFITAGVGPSHAYKGLADYISLFMITAKAHNTAAIVYTSRLMQLRKTQDSVWQCS